MNNQTKAILNLILIFSGAILVAWLLAKLALYFSIFLVNTFGVTYITFCVNLVGALAAILPAFGIGLALVKRFHTHPRVMAALDMSSLKV